MDVARHPVGRGEALVWIQRGAAGTGEAGSVELNGGMYALKDNDGGAMGEKRVREESPSMKMAQMGRAGGCARMLLQYGVERTRGWQRAAKRTQQSG